MNKNDIQHVASKWDWEGWNGIAPEGGGHAGVTVRGDQVQMSVKDAQGAESVIALTPDQADVVLNYLGLAVDDARRAEGDSWAELADIPVGVWFEVTEGWSDTAFVRVGQGYRVRPLSGGHPSEWSLVESELAPRGPFHRATHQRPKYSNGMPLWRVKVDEL